MEDIVTKVAELIKGEESPGATFEAKFRAPIAEDETRVLKCCVPWVDASQGMVDLTISGQIVSVLKPDRGGMTTQIACASAPFQVFLNAEGALPTFDTHTKLSSGTECLCEKLEDALNAKDDKDIVVALVIMDEGALNWSEQLTEVLLRMGAKYVPPQYRAAWAFLWTPTQRFESYKKPYKGVASLRATVNGREFVLESAGFRDGNFAQVKVDGVNQFKTPKRGVNCCIWGSTRELLVDRRRFQEEIAFVSHLSQVPSGVPCIMICAGMKYESSQGFGRSFYAEALRLGGSGQTLGLSEPFVLAGTMHTSPMVKRGKPSQEEITRAFQHSPSEFNGFAFASLLFGQNPAMCLGALVLARSLQKQTPSLPRILLVSQDVPNHFRKLLQDNGWQVKNVTYIRGAHTHFKEGAKFPPEIFMKLHAFNPGVLNYEKVLFLDLDIIVRKDLTSVFSLPTPAAVNNYKSRDAMVCIQEGEIMDPSWASINAGVLLVSPNAALFHLLENDAQRPGTHHRMHWCPEQTYLSTILAGIWRHLHCKYNFECQIHGGTWCSADWQKCEIDDIHIVHFSGQSPWELSSHDEITCVDRRGFEPDRKKYRQLESDHYRKLASQRSHLFHEEWFNLFGEFDFLQDESLDGPSSEDYEGIIPLKRMTVFLERIQ